MEKGEQFVKREYGVGLAQSKVCCDSEEVNLINMIEVRSQDLMKSLNDIESSTSALNKNLLPAGSQGESEAKVEAKKPQGWLEKHLADLNFLISRAGQIHYQVIRLMQATKTDKLG